MSFWQSLLVIVCFLTGVVELMLLISVAALPKDDPTLSATVRGFVYGFLPAVLSATYLLHLATAGTR